MSLCVVNIDSTSVCSSEYQPSITDRTIGRSSIREYKTYSDDDSESHFRVETDLGHALRSSSLTSALGVDLMWVLVCPVIRCGVGFGAVPRRFLVLIFTWGSYWIQTSRVLMDLSSCQFRQKYFARRFSYEQKANRLSLLCSRCERLKSRQKYEPRPFTISKGYIYVI